MSASNPARTPLALVINSVIVFISFFLVDLGYRAWFTDAGDIMAGYPVAFFANLAAGSVLYAFLYNKASYLWRPQVNRGFLRSAETSKVPSEKMTGMKVINGAILGLISVTIFYFFTSGIMFGGGGSGSGDSSTTTTVLVVVVIVTAGILEWKGRTEDDGDG